jgi:hypothetical protein
MEDFVELNLEGGYMTSEELKKMSEMTFRDVERDELIELGSMTYDMDKPPGERVEKLFSTGKNPYFRRAGDGSIIKISFSSNGRSFEDNLVNLITGE